MDLLFFLSGAYNEKNEEEREGKMLLFGIACFAALLGTFVNGVTDAPVTMSAAVLSGAMSRRTAALVSAVGNGLGLLLSAVFFPSVLNATLSFAPFDGEKALGGVAVVLLSAILWAAAASRFGIPTSESHALMSALAGASVAFGMGTQILPSAAAAVLGLFLSVAGGFMMCRILMRSTEAIGRHIVGRRAGWERMTAWSAALMSFWHGAQDGQKFAGLFFLVLQAAEKAPSPLLLWIPVAVLSAGSAFVGGSIMEALAKGDGAVFDPPAAELSSTVTVAACTLLGLPVSTTHIKTAALAAAGHRGLFGKTFFAGLLTLPVCFALAYWAVKIFL